MTLLKMVLCCSLISALASAQVWTIRTVDSGCGNVSTTSLELDTMDQAHISYGSYTNGSQSAQKYAVGTGSIWNTSVVASDFTGDMLGRHSSIALDTAENPVISYTNRNAGNLYYAGWTGSSWSIEIVDSGDTYMCSPSICVNSLNSPSIAYSKGNLLSSNTMYARFDSSWLVSYIDVTPGRGWWVSMALNSLDKPNVAYCDNNNPDALWYAVLGPEHWARVLVDSSSSGAGTNCSIAIDSNDRPHISYSGVVGSENALKYAYYNGSSWEISVVDNSGECGQAHTSIALDTSDNPHISYYHHATESLKYAYHDGSDTWTFTTVDAGGFETGACSSIDIDSDGNPHISYKKGLPGSENLMYAYYGSSDIGDEEEEAQPAVLTGITPNPCSGSAEAVYFHPVSGHVDLDLFDITGRKVADLSEGLSPAGAHTVQLSGLESGIYLLRLEIGGHSDCRKLIVVR